MTEAFALPEFTRALRSFASPRALGPDHERFFAPLLGARRAAAQASRWQSRLDAFDADRLDATMRMTLGTLASERFPTSAPDERALTAQLEDACGGFFDALGPLGASAAAVREAAGDDARGVAWDAFVEALRRVFVGADHGWEQARALLDAHPAPARRRAKARARSRR